MQVIDYLLPDLYKKDLNIVSHSAEILDKVIQEFHNTPVLELEKHIESEFLLSQVTPDEFSMRSLELLKAFFQFKGTNADLIYMLKISGLDAQIYNDGSILHNYNNNLEVVPTNDNKVRGNPCEIEMEVVVDTSSSSYKGYQGGDLSKILKIVEARIHACIFLAKIRVGIRCEDLIQLSNFNEIIHISSSPSPVEERVFDEYSLNMQYYTPEGAVYSKQHKTYFGGHLQKYFRPLYDEVQIITKIEYEFSDNMERVFNHLYDDVSMPYTIKDAFNPATLQDARETEQQYSHNDKLDVSTISDEVRLIPEQFIENVNVEQKSNKFNEIKYAYGTQPNDTGLARYGRKSLDKLRDLFDNNDKK